MTKENQNLLQDIQRVGQDAARQAGALLREAFTRPQRITLKGVHDPVTESDFRSQELIVGLIRRHFPRHRILAEEVGDTVAGGEFAAGGGPAAENTAVGGWIIDPLDGTVNFAHGFPVFAVSIAYEAADGEVHYGVVYDPMREELFEGIKGGGATLNGRPLRVSRVDLLDRALLATGFPYDVAQRLESTVSRFRRMLLMAQGVRRAGSAALDLCYLAAGRFDGFWEENLKPWDTAAAALIVREAGGRLSNLAGGPFTPTDTFVVASNGLLHDQLWTALQL